MLRKLWAWFVGERFVYAVELDGQRVRCEAPTLPDLIALIHATGGEVRLPEDTIEARQLDAIRRVGSNTAEVPRVAADLNAAVAGRGP